MHIVQVLCDSVINAAKLHLVLERVPLKVPLKRFHVLAQQVGYHATNKPGHCGNGYSSATKELRKLKPIHRMLQLGVFRRCAGA
jgi:hypothetical protein